MASYPTPPVTKKIGSIYSWLMRQPEFIVSQLRSISDAEKLFDACNPAGSQILFDNLPAGFMMETLGYDIEAVIPTPPEPTPRLTKPR